MPASSASASLTWDACSSLAVSVPSFAPIPKPNWAVPVLSGTLRAVVIQK